ncbi:MAG: hypothetical protein A3C11_02220 [Candidatus Sungbacteria bacterium RIFCSPHIGHO2_02_FULL_49_12]|uniref:SHSP domain-containing protein n=1 Tax=Candidatus Sungbacteria bacterium RIFCSPHIGHO2_02_FULL_49_12 TaxID=1802271 RepID=A0A1G2KPM3_9BACT|nr:MAG: hypothetical protein A3C11_02220 [Candidatus Sungbacteria bacterium RIFCSPHIGHO2_02_FULL_49_12]
MADPRSFFERLTGSKSAAVPAEPPKERTSQISGRTTAGGAKTEEDFVPQQEEEGELTVDIYDDGDYVVIQAIVGGVKPEDIDVQVTDDVVTVRGKRLRTQEIDEGSFYYRELYWGSFSRSIILPQEIISDEAEASMKNGLLTVKLPKRDRNKAQKLRVKSD